MPIKLAFHGAKEIRIFGETYRVHAKVYTIGGFSAHADRDLLLEWLSHSKGIERLFLIHGGKKTLLSFEKELSERKISKNIHIPETDKQYLF
jgi:metallo-beta-lactamase family protein